MPARLHCRSNPQGKVHCHRRIPEAYAHALRLYIQRPAAQQCCKALCGRQRCVDLTATVHGCSLAAGTTASPPKRHICCSCPADVWVAHGGRGRCQRHGTLHAWPCRECPPCHGEGTAATRLHVTTDVVEGYGRSRSRGCLRSCQGPAARNFGRALLPPSRGRCSAHAMRSPPHLHDSVCLPPQAAWRSPCTH